MGCRCLKVRFAAIGGVVVAVGPIRLARRDRAFPCSTCRCCVWQVAHGRALTAVIGIDGERSFTAVGRIAVTVIIARGTGGNALAAGTSRGTVVVGARWIAAPADAGLARKRGITGNLAGAAIGAVRLQVDFATIIVLPVTISKTCFTRRDAAFRV